ncbi:PilZ domain-containing protein [Methylomonas sp. AM2-LC]|uniref:PilZ domain-containing protein n=1 Tax=Methylomonas sp. AM2-LC TaxID=3153301 RepID=UPI003267C248
MVELLPAFDTRMARETLHGLGWVCIGSVEHKISLLNVSLTGILAELQYNDQVPDYYELFKSLQAAPLIDFYLPEMRLAGEAVVVRVESIKCGFHLGIEFRNLTSNIDELLYKRRVFRKNLVSLGHIFFHDNHYSFNTESVSVYGMVIRILNRIDFEIGSVTRFEFKQLDLQGEVQIIWGDRDYNSTLLGLQFLQKARGVASDNKLIDNALNVAI